MSDEQITTPFDDGHGDGGSLESVADQDGWELGDDALASGGDDESGGQVLAGQRGSEGNQGGARPQADDEADIPEQFRGKSKREVIEQHHSLEQKLGRQSAEVGAARTLFRELGIEVPDGSPITREMVQQALATSTQEREIDTPPVDTELQQIELNFAGNKYNDLLEIEAVRLAAAGELDMTATAADVHAYLQANNPLRFNALQNTARSFGHQQVQQYQQLADRRAQAMVAPVMGEMAPAIVGREVAAVLTTSPVQGVTAGEISHAIMQSGIPLQQWTSAEPAQKQSFIIAAANQLFREKFERGEIVPPNAVPKAPAQTPPGSLPAGGSAPTMAIDPRMQRTVERIMTATGLSREDALDVARG